MKILATLCVVFLCGFAFVAILLPAFNVHNQALYTRMGVQWYEQRRTEAAKGDISQAASSLKQVVEFWPLKVPRHGDFAGVVSAFQASTIREIIARMRSLAGEDLGEDPQPWLEKYYKKEKAGPNHPAAGKAGFGLLFAFGHHWPGLPEPQCWAAMCV